MGYKVPFYAVQGALYKVLSAADDSLSWFDAGASIEEIEGFYKSQQFFAYGIMGASDADAEPNKDTIVWNDRLDLEIYSNYQGKKTFQNVLKPLSITCAAMQHGKTLTQLLLSKDLL